MSRYFQTLKRLQAGKNDELAPVGLGEDSAEPVPVSDSYPFQRIAMQSAKAQAAFSRLLDSCRLAAMNTASRSIVVASVSSERASRFVMAGLETAAEQRPLEFVAGELRVFAGDRFVSLHRATASASGREVRPAAGPSTTESTLALDLSDSSLPEQLRAAIERVNPKVDVAVLHGPPVNQSVEATLLANATAGIVLVLEPLITTRSDLFLALDRVEHSESTMLGVVTVGSRTSLPRWLKRALAGTGQ